MSATAQLTKGRETRAMRTSQRLNALRLDAEKIRRSHASGEISADEAAKQLSALKLKYVGFFERILDL